MTGLRIAAAPDSWGVWFADHPRQIPWRRFLDEASDAGYRYLELGPFGYLPTDPGVLADELAARDLTLCGGTIFTGLHRPGSWDAAWERAAAVARLVTAVGGTDLVVIPDLWRSDLTGEDLEPRTLTDEQWAQLSAGHDRLGRALVDEFGVAQRFHSHADSHIRTTEEISRLLDATDPANLSLCLDTGHLAYYGGDCLDVIDRYPDRVGYLHLKQVDPVVRDDVLAGDVPFAECAATVMVEPPGGIPDFAPILEAAARLDPDMVAVVEQDMPGCDPDRPFPIATRTRRHILSCCGGAR